MSYSEWIKFVLGAFTWSLTDGDTYMGSLKREEESEIAYVEITIGEDHLWVNLNYKTIPNYQLWKYLEENIRVIPVAPSEAFYRGLVEHSAHKLLYWDCKSFYVDGKELNLIPWVKEIVYRSM